MCLDSNSISYARETCAHAYIECYGICSPCHLAGVLIEEMLMQAFIRLTFAASLVTQLSALSRAAMGVLVDLTQAPPHTIKEEEGSRAAPATAHHGPAVSTRPARKLPAYVSCRDLGHFIDGVDESVLQKDEDSSKLSLIHI